jgi:hypothetical protein
MAVTGMLATVVLPYIINKVAKHALPAIAKKLDKKTTLPGGKYRPRLANGKLGKSVEVKGGTRVTETNASKAVRDADKLRQDAADVLAGFLPVIYRTVGAGGKVAGSIAGNAAKAIGGVPLAIANTGISARQNQVWGDSPLQAGAKAIASLGNAAGSTFDTAGSELQKLMEETARGRQLLNLNNRLSRELTQKANAIHQLGLTSGEAELAGRYISSLGFGSK